MLAPNYCTACTINFFSYLIILYLYSAKSSIDSKCLWHSFLICSIHINLKPSRGYTCSSPLRRSSNCARHSLWLEDHRVLSLQICGFFHVPKDGSPGTLHHHLYHFANCSILYPFNADCLARKQYVSLLR